MTPAEARLRKLRMRSWRRGTREMDLILGPFADTAMASLCTPDLDLYERLLEENDQELYLWVTGASAVPDPYGGLIDTIAAQAGIMRR